MSKKYFSGNTLEQAVLQAARHFGLESAAVGYEQVQKRHGFLKSRRRIVIAVDPEAPGLAQPAIEPVGEVNDAPSDGADRAGLARDGAPASSPGGSPLTEVDSGSEPSVSEGEAKGIAGFAPAKTAPAETSPVGTEEAAQEEGGEQTVGPANDRAHSPADTSEPADRLVSLADGPRRARERFPRAAGALADAAHEALRRLFELGALELEADVLQGEERLEIELWGRDQALLLDDRGRLMLAIQHLLPRAIRGLAGESIHCRVDCDNFHEIRAEQLRDLAQRVASEVREKSRPQALEPMSPDERRIVHLTLSDDPAVETVSRGEGLFKRVTVKPAGR